MRARRTCARCLSASVLSSSPPPTDCRRPSHAAAQNVSLLPRPRVRSFSLSLSHSGLISFDGKMNVIISLPQKKNPPVPLPISTRESQFSLRSPYAAAAALLRVELRRCEPVSPAARHRGPQFIRLRGGHPRRRRGQRVREAVLPSIGACPRPPARRPSVESPSDVTGYSLTLWLSR